MYKRVFNGVNSEESKQGSDGLIVNLVKSMMDYISSNDNIVVSYETTLILLDPSKDEIIKHELGEKAPLIVNVQSNGVVRIADCVNHSSFGNLLRFLENISEMKIIMNDNIYDYFRSKFSKLYKESFGITDVEYSYDTCEINNFLKIRRIGYKIESINVGTKESPDFRKALVKSSDNFTELTDDFTTVESHNIEDKKDNDKEKIDPPPLNETMDSLVEYLYKLFIDESKYDSIPQKQFIDGLLAGLRRMIVYEAYEATISMIMQHNFEYEIDKVNYILTQFNSKYRILNVNDKWKLTNADAYYRATTKLDTMGDDNEVGFTETSFVDYFIDHNPKFNQLFDYIKIKHPDTDILECVVSGLYSKSVDRVNDILNMIEAPFAIYATPYRDKLSIDRIELIIKDVVNKCEVSPSSKDRIDEFIEDEKEYNDRNGKKYIDIDKFYDKFKDLISDIVKTYPAEAIPWKTQEGEKPKAYLSKLYFINRILRSVDSKYVLYEESKPCVRIRIITKSYYNDLCSIEVGIGSTVTVEDYISAHLLFITKDFIESRNNSLNLNEQAFLQFSDKFCQLIYDMLQKFPVSELVEYGDPGIYTKPLERINTIYEKLNVPYRFKKKDNELCENYEIEIISKDETPKFDDNRSVKQIFDDFMQEESQLYSSREISVLNMDDIDALYHGFMRVMSYVADLCSKEGITDIPKVDRMGKVEYINIILNLVKCRFRIQSTLEPKIGYVIIENQIENQEIKTFQKEDTSDNSRSLNKVFDEWIKEEIDLFALDHDRPVVENDKIDTLHYRFSIMIEFVLRSFHKELPNGLPKLGDKSKFEHINDVLDIVGSMYKLEYAVTDAGKPGYLIAERTKKA